MRKFLGVLTVAVSGLSLFGCTSSGGEWEDLYLNDTAALEKSFVPAVFYTSLDTNTGVFPVAINVPDADIANASLDALTTFEARWNSYSAKYGNRYDYSGWGARFAEVDTDIATAKQTYQAIIADGSSYGTSGASALAAHNAMENTRLVLTDMRLDNGVSYLMDSSTDAHTKMEPLVGAAVKFKNSATTGFTADDMIAAVANSLPPFQDAWMSCASKMSSEGATLASSFGISDGKMAYLGGLFNAMDTPLAYLSDPTNMIAANASTIMSNIFMVKGIYAKTYLAMGDFFTPFEADMVAFDQALVGSLLATSGSVLSNAQNAINGLNAKWAAYKLNYSPSMYGRKNMLNWETHMVAIEAGLAAADLEINTNSDIAAAHAEVENVRNALYAWRHTYENHSVVTDILTTYHHTFEPALAPIAAYMTGGSRTIDTATVRTHLDAAELLLSGVRRAVKANVFGVDVTTALAALDNHIATYATLRAALDVYDADSTIANADAVVAIALTNSDSFKKTFAGFFSLFKTQPV